MALDKVLHKKVIKKLVEGYRTQENFLRWIGDRIRDDITGAFGIPGENSNGRKSGGVLC